MTSQQCQPIIQALCDLQRQAGREKRTCPVLDAPVELVDEVKRFVNNGNKLVIFSRWIIKVELDNRKLKAEVCWLN